jgi:hypothetical protein
MFTIVLGRFHIARQPENSKCFIAQIQFLRSSLCTAHRNQIRYHYSLSESISTMRVYRPPRHCRHIDIIPRAILLVQSPSQLHPMPRKSFYSRNDITLVASQTPRETLLVRPVSDDIADGFELVANTGILDHSEKSLLQSRREQRTQSGRSMIVEQSRDHGHEAQYSAVHIIATVRCRL